VAVDYEPLDAVVTMDDAARDNTIIHAAAGTNLATGYVMGRGRRDAAFATADHVIERTLSCHRHTPAPLETRGLVAAYDAAQDRLRVLGATKVNFYNRRLLATFMDMDEVQIDLIEVDVGGGFGVRGEFYPEDFLIPFAARALARPVAWIEDRREHLMATNHSRELDCTLAMAFRNDGLILGMRATLRGDMGAYIRTNGGVVPTKGAQFLPGPYRIDDFVCRVEAYVTNKTPMGTYRGPGRFEANYFRERLFDIAAAELEIDPVALRRKNLLGADDMPYDIGDLVPGEAPGVNDAGEFEACFDRALEAVGYTGPESGGRHEDGRYHGIGFACFTESSGAGPAESARITIHSATDIRIHSGASSVGQGLETALAQIGADSLGVTMAGITVQHGSTTIVDQGWGTYASRSTVMAGSAVKLAADKIKAAILSLAGRRLNLDAAELEFRDGAVHRLDGTGNQVMSLDEVLSFARETNHTAATDPALEEAAIFELAERTYSAGAHAVRVAVDVETGAVEVLHYVTVEDIGRAVNPQLVHGQALGGLVMGLGGTLLDELIYDETGQLLTANLADYLLPTSTSFSNLESIILEAAPSRLNPLGVKGAGEGGIVAVAGALANAVANALAEFGVEVTELPIRPDNVLRWLREADHGH
jgi:carbon-monoxide dehydrogenase large subunit